MCDFYGIYASCRDAAWKYLIDFDISSLPVMLVGAASRAGIRVIANSDVDELKSDELGASIRLPSGEWRIVYDDSLTPEESRMVIAHELGHILLGHEYKYRDCRFAKGNGKLKSEREADMFAVRILAPACVLHEIGVLESHDISSHCMIPKNIAKVRAKRMQVLEARNSFYKSKLENDVRNKFRDYINKNTNIQK